MITASPIARCPQVQPSASWAGNADRSIRDHHARSHAAPPQRVLTILPPVTALAVGLPAQRAIAQRFSALDPKRPSPTLARCDAASRAMRAEK
jgi:hypothetical protein